MSDQRDTHDRLSGPMRAALEQSMLTPSGECPDAGTLAAYFDRTLTRPLLDDCTRHLSTCGRCQAVLAAVARSDDAAPAGAQGRAWPSLMRGRWRWLVPATATAAALAVWMVVERPDDAPGQMYRQEGSPSARNEGEMDVERPGIDLPAILERRSEPRGTSDAASTPTASPPALLEGKADSTAGRTRANETARIAEGELLKDEAFQAAPMPSPPRAIAAATPPASSEGRSDKARDSEASTMAGSRGGVFDAIGAAPPLEVRSPDPAIRWRLVGSSIQKSTDDGASWILQHLESRPALIAGSSPSPAVCWVVGEGGIVLRTVDGATWERLTAPSSEDVVAIVAVSETDATITTRTGQQFVTVDGGRTWRRA